MAFTFHCGKAPSLIHCIGISGIKVHLVMYTYQVYKWKGVCYGARQHCSAKSDEFGFPVCFFSPFE